MEEQLKAVQEVIEAFKERVAGLEDKMNATQGNGNYKERKPFWKRMLGGEHDGPR